ncbi:MAG: hypothetical protein PHX58_04515 [Desulfovibrio sp.]|jgi:hypothetical protein|nr:hypothetical protein [Desulfovibrio sp.]
MSRDVLNPGGGALRVQADPDLEYLYYDIFNVYVGAEEVVLELGNRHRSDPESAVVHQRVVLSPGTARKLANTLGKGLQAMEEKIRSALNEAGKYPAN